jgi:O-Antigen ligase
LTTAAAPRLLALAGQETLPKVGSGSRFYQPGLLFPLMVSTGLAACYRIDVSRSGKAMLVLGLCLAFAAAYTAFAHPRRFPLLAIAYIPFNARFPVNIGSTSLNLTNILLLLGIVAMVSAPRPQRRPFGALEYSLLVFLGFAFMAFVTSVVAHGGQDFVAEAFRCKQWMTPFLVFFLVRRLAWERDDLIDMMVVLLWTSTLVGGLTWWEGRQSNRSSIDRSRVGAVIGQANAMAAFLVYYSLPALALFLRMKGRAVRAACLSAFLIMVRGMLFAMSRGAYLALAAGAAVVILLRSPLLLVITLAVAFAAPEYAPWMVPASVLARLRGTQQSDSLDPDMEARLDKSSQQRLMLWDAGTAMIRNHPWRGVGLNRFSEEVGGYTLSELTDKDPKDAHNAYIKVAAEMGIPALLAMAVLLVHISSLAVPLYFRRTDLFDRSLALALVGSVTGLVVSCLFGSRFTDENLMCQFWVLVASVRVLGFLPAGVEPAGPEA